MACGVPVVASDTSSLAEVVGDAGLRVPTGGGGELLAAMRRLLSQPELARELGERGVERARRFSWRRAAEGMEEVFRRTAAGA